MKTKNLKVLFNEKEYCITLHKKKAINTPELSLLIKDMSKLIGYQANRIMTGYKDVEYMDIWQLLAMTAIYLLGIYKPEKSAFNTYFTSYAPRLVRKILTDHRYKLNAYLFEDIYKDPQLIELQEVEDDPFEE